MNWTEAQAREYMQKRLKDEQRTRTKLYAKNHTALEGLPATEPEPASGQALVSDSPRETPSSTGDSPRITIRYVVRSRRPMDFDNANTKFATDVLVKTGILPRDGWDILQGQVVTEKCDSAEEEGTTIVIESL